MRRLVFLTALGLAGCVTQPTRPELSGDPLLGGGGAIPERAVASRTEDDLLRPRIAAPPPIGASAASPAALATGGVAGAGVTLGSPRPAAPAPAPMPELSTSSLVPVGAPGPATYEQVQAKLKARGVDWQSLTHRGGDAWQFHCAIPDPKNPGMRLNFETARPCPTPVAAMEAVLREIEAAPKPR